MIYDQFQVQFNWKSNRRLVQIRTRKVMGTSPVIANYQVIWNDTHLFTIYPTFNANCRKVWKIVELERESHLPYGFIATLGSIIEEVYHPN